MLNINSIIMNYSKNLPCIYVMLHNDQHKNK